MNRAGRVFGQKGKPMVRGQSMEDIFTNPSGWGEQVVGTPFKYRWMQAFTLAGVVVTVFLPEVLWLFVWDIAPDGASEWLRPLFHRLGIALLVILLAGMMPLFYLRAMRHLVLKVRQIPKG
jgi:hypothetical protein